MPPPERMTTRMPEKPWRSAGEARTSARGTGRPPSSTTTPARIATGWSVKTGPAASPAFSAASGTAPASPKPGSWPAAAAARASGAPGAAVIA